jgi:hypothetical protein
MKRLRKLLRRLKSFLPLAYEGCDEFDRTTIPEWAKNICLGHQSCRTCPLQGLIICPVKGKSF